MRLINLKDDKAHCDCWPRKATLEGFVNVRKKGIFTQKGYRFWYQIIFEALSKLIVLTLRGAAINGKCIAEEERFDGTNMFVGEALEKGCLC